MQKLLRVPSFFSSSGKRRKSRGAASLLGGFEFLEDRCVLATLVVNTEGDTVNANDGVTSLREALAQAYASPGQDTVTFDADVFAFPKTISLSLGALSIPYSGESNKTMVQGPAPGVTLSGNGTSVGISIAGGGVLELDNITLADCSGFYGAAIVNAGHLTATNVTFINNVADDRGGGIFNGNGATAAIHRSTFRGNIGYGGGGGGGAIWSEGILTLSESLVSDNSGFGAAGAMYNRGTMTIDKSIIENNRGVRGGGGLWNRSRLTITETTFRGNQAGNGGGGGLMNEDAGYALVRSSVFSGNTATAGGAIANYTRLVLTDSLIEGNRAGSGGGLRLGGATQWVGQTTISGNTADAGGGMFVTTHLTLVQSTIHANVATSGGGIHSGAASFLIQNSIVSGNRRPNGSLDEYAVLGNSTTAQNSLIGAVGSGTIDGTGNTISSDPRLGPLQDNGGATKTHALLPDSPAIDAGNDLLAVDQEGVPFPYDQRTTFARLSNARVDIGAFEYQGTLPPASTDIRVTSFTAEELAYVTLSYSIVGVAAPSFKVRIVSSSDTLPGSDLPLAEVTISSPADLTPGSHTKGWPIGGGPGEVPLPGFGGAETNADYFLLAIADPDDVVRENDATGTAEDNVGVFMGSYFSGQGPLMVHGGPAADAVTIGTSPSIVINSVSQALNANAVTGLRVRLHGGGDVFDGATYIKPVVVFGGDGDDTITTGITDDQLSGGAGADGLNGGRGNDTYLFDTDVPLGVDTLFEASSTLGGIDRLDFADTGAMEVQVDLGIVPTAGQVVNANLTLKLNATTAFEQIVGGNANDRLQGNGLANLLVGNGGHDVLLGGAGNDTYAFDADQWLGTDVLVEPAVGGGTDSLVFADTNTLAVAVDLSQATWQVVNSNLSLVLGAGSRFENVTGGGLGDTLVGNAQANSLLGGPGSDTISGGSGNDLLEGALGDDLLTGGDGDDVYRLDADLPLGTDTISEVPGVGVDTLDFSLTTLKSISVNLGVAEAQVVNSNLKLMLGSANSVESVLGGAMADTLSGNALDNRLLGGPGNDTLAGGTGDDTYLFDADLPQGSDLLIEAASGGSDVLDFAQTTSKALTISLARTDVQVVATNLSLTLSGAEVFESVVGGTLNDAITGNGQANKLTGNGGNDTLTGGGGGDTLIGGPGNDSLSGGPGDDTYSFTANTPLGVDTLIDAGGYDLLDFSSSTVAVAVDLGITTTQVVNTALSLNLGASDALDMVVGSSANDTLRGNSLDNVLIGGAGNDSLVGGGGRDLLFGGSQVDTLDGGDGDDVLVSGLFAYFNEATRSLNRLALDAIRSEWSRLDQDYSQRLARLRNGGGLNGNVLLNASTVLTDGAAIDTLFGRAGIDWFWAFGGDLVSDLNTLDGESLN